MPLLGRMTRFDPRPCEGATRLSLLVEDTPQGFDPRPCEGATR